VNNRRGVIVDNGVVTNVVVWGEESQEQFSTEGHDRMEETTDWAIQPGIGWSWSKKYGYRPPQPFPSWTWNAGENDWLPPVPMPTVEGFWYEWNEEEQTWIQHEIEQPAE